MFNILPLPALYDNYIWLIMHPVKHTAVIVDPGESQVVLSTLAQHNLKLTAILITHHHADHTQGLDGLLAEYPVPVLGPNTPLIPQITHPLDKEDNITLPGLELGCQIIQTPGHTQDHISYYTDNGLLFSGDTLFTGGCGRLFEGTPTQMYHALLKLMNLPDETQLYCGHEYTQKNLEFACCVEPQNALLLKRLEEVNALRKNNQPTVPASMHLEKQTNPFLRCHLQSVKATVEQRLGQALNDPIEVFSAIRHWKDQW